MQNIKIGDKINNWTIIDDDVIRKNKKVYYLAKCDCGNIKEKRIDEMKIAKKCKKCKTNKYFFYKDHIKVLTSSGIYFFIDVEDYDRVKESSWCCRKNDENIVTRKNKKNILLHRLIMNQTDDRVQIDHIDHDRKNNRKDNLRIATNQQNSFNRRKRNINATSKYIGVSYRKDVNKWRAMISHNYKTFHLGYFKSEIESAKAYNEKAKELFGEFSCLNKFE